MAYPSDNDISSWASANAADPEPVYGFVASKGRLPLNAGELSGYSATELANPNYAGAGNPMLIWAYIINNRGDAPSNAAFLAWLNNQGYDANGVPTGQLPQVGQGYDQAVGLSSAPPTSGTPASGGTAPPVAAAPGPLDSLMATVSAHPVISAVVGVGVAYGAYKVFGGHRR